MRTPTHNSYGTILTALAMLVLSSGCGQMSAQDNSVTAVPVTCPACEPVGTNGTLPTAPAGTNNTGTGTNPSTTGFQSGSTVVLNATGGALAGMFYNSLPNNPQNIRINLNTGRPGQEVIISYVENNNVVSAALGSRHPYNPGVQDTSYNGWTNDGNNPVWKGFFQDGYGAVVVVLDSAIGTGDGSANQLGGSIYFQNFPQTVYPNSPYAPAQGSEKLCWKITLGPFDCRTFLVGDNLVINSSLHPNNKGANAVSYYQLLGTFAGIDRGAAGL